MSTQTQIITTSNTSGMIIISPINAEMIALILVLMVIIVMIIHMELAIVAKKIKLRINM